MRGCKKLDGFIKEMLLEQSKSICLSQEKSLANLQQRIEFVYGPLSKIWAAVEEEKTKAEDGGNVDENDPIFATSQLFSY